MVTPRKDWGGVRGVECDALGSVAVSAAPYLCCLRSARADVEVISYSTSCAAVVFARDESRRRIKYGAVSELST
ncbi:hypothetical protein MRX96_031043 [Rhipicephalus microplus]